MKLTDIILLAKQGFTAKDIKELINTEVAEPTGEDTTVEVPGENVAKETTITAEENTTQTQEEIAQENYKELYEKAINDLNTKTEELKNAQSQNLNQNVAQTAKSNEELLTEMVRGFM